MVLSGSLLNFFIVSNVAAECLAGFLKIHVLKHGGDFGVVLNFT